MVKLSCILHKNLFYPQIFVFLIVVFSAFDRAEATRVTIDSGDASPAPNYRSLDLFLKALDGLTAASVPDTVLFKGSKPYTYSASQSTSNTNGGKKIYFLGTATNPDSFPIINHTGDNFYNFFKKTPTSFERLAFTGKIAFHNGNSTNDLTFSQCVIRNYTTNFFRIAGSASPKVSFSNCLFANNDSILETEFWNNGSVPSPYLEITNCTFDNNKSIFNVDQSFSSNFVFKNNIFSNNKSTLPGPLLKAKTTYSITSDSLTSYGTGCYRLLPADTTALYKFASRTIPSHWQLGSTSKAAEFLTTAAVLNVDIAGTPRGTTAPPSDVGCWKFDNSLKISKQPRNDTAVAGTYGVFTIVTQSTRAVTYAWYRKGGPDTLVISTSDTCRVTADSASDSSRYWCVVSNSSGSNKSDTVTLRTMYKPVIVNDRSEGISVQNGDTASFRISATGYKLSYHWYLGTSTTQLKSDTTKPYCKIDTIFKEKHDNVLLYCEVINPAGRTKSLADTLHVGSRPPVISKDPLNEVRYEGETAHFSVEATGYGPLDYTWYQTDSAMTTKKKLSGNSNTLTLTGVTTASSGSAYYCEVSTMFGDVKRSNPAYLTVKPITAPVITDQTPGLETRVGSNDSLYVIVNGNGTKYNVKWYRDGSLVDSASPAVYNIPEKIVYNIPSAIMSKDSSYTYHCVASNDSGKAISKDIKVTIHPKDQSYNPVTLKGKFINRSSILLTIKNFRGLPVNGASLFVDAIGVWYQETEFQNKPDPKATNLIMFPLDVLRARGVNDSFDTLINIAMGDKECDSICFIATPSWKPDNSLPEFISANGTKVYSCGTGSTDNPLSLTISQIQTANDSVTLSIDGFSSLQKNNVSKVVTYISTSESTIYETIKSEDFPLTGPYTKNISNALFAGQTHTIFTGIYFRSIEGNYSDTNKKQVTVGFPIPDNNAILSIGDFHASEGVLKWTNVTADKVDSVRIWYGTDTIPLIGGMPSPSTNHKSKTVSTTQDTVIITELTDMTRYYFVLQLQSHRVWSGTTTDASRYTTTKPLDTSKINNTIKITSAFFDTSTNIFIVKFTFDSTGSGKEIFYARPSYNKVGYDSAAIKGTPLRLKFITDGDTNTMKIDLANELDFDTSYFISLEAQSKDASWSAATDSSHVDPIKTPDLKWMRITYFKPNDSIYKTFEGKVLFKKSPKWYTAIYEGYNNLTDILYKYNFDQTKMPTGFLPVSIGVKFRNPKENLSAPELHFGIRIDSLPPPFLPKDVNMYVYDTLTGNFKIINTRDSNDSGGVVSVLIKPEDYTSPLMLMIDTQKPQVSVSDTTEPLEVADYNYIIKVKDNVSNAFAIIKYGAGSDPLTLSDTIRVSDVSDTLVKIPSKYISGNSGLRALLIVTDGRFLDTINLSRVVYNNLVRNTGEMSWFPLCVHYELNSVEVSQLFDSLSGPEKKYDNTKFRLFKWYDSLEYPTKVGKYVEYDMVKENDTLFDLKPGNLLWLKTRKSTQLNFGKVKTLSLKHGYSVKLPPNTWTDVAVPFEYSIKIYDILKATGINNDSNTLVIYKWNMSTKTYSSSSIHDPAMSDESHPEREMSGKNDSIYTIYNLTENLTDTVILNFPPIPSSMSEYVPSVKKRATSDWRFTITASTKNEELNPIYCGFKSGGLKKTLIPIAPSLGSLRMGVLENGICYGIAVNHDKTDGYAYNLKVENKEVSKQLVRCNIVENVASGMNMKIFDPITGSTQDVKAGFSVDVDGQSSAQRWLLVGNNSFIGKFIQKNVQFNLLQLYPNPFRGFLNIKFTIPLTGVNSVNCMLFNALGRQIWDFKIDKALHPGLNVFVWQPGQGAIKSLASGTYFFKIVAKDPNGKITGSKLAKLMYFTH